MEKIVITGGNQLNGEVTISGAKNAALPELCASLLTAQEIKLTNLPNLRDVNTMLELLQSLGVHTSFNNAQAQLCATNLHSKAVAEYDLVKTMRASILVLGPLLARNGFAKVSLPGGCAIGARPVEQHIKGLQQMGGIIEVTNGYITAHLPAGKTRLTGTSITTDMITVTGTANLMMAATLAEGTTILENAAQEPEIVDLANLLIKMGADISGHGSSKITINGVKELNGCQHHVISDRIEAGTFLCAVAVTGGNVQLRAVQPEHLGAVLEKLIQAGVNINCQNDTIQVISNGATSLTAQSFKTSEYPAFPTDMQAQFMALNSVANGASMVTETIFENRFMHVSELSRLGAQIIIDGRTAMIEGGAKLSGASVMATDLRASACLVIAALVAQGTTTIDRIYHLDRGYENVEQKLRALGADIQRISN